MLETADERHINSGRAGLGAAKPSAGTDPWSQLATLGATSPALDDLLELLIAWTHATVGTGEIVQASERFYCDYGKVFHDDTFYDTRTTYFFNHLIFQRQLSGDANSQVDQSLELGLTGVTPFQLFLSRSLAQTPPISTASRQILADLGTFRHSLFQIHRLSDKAMVLLDLLEPAKLHVAAKAGETFRALEKKTILQGFIFKTQNQHCLNSGLVLHPLKANGAIRKRLKQRAKSGLEDKEILLARLANLQIRYLRHRHVHPKLIYQAIES